MDQPPISHPIGPRWYVLSVIPKKEFSVEDELAEIGLFGYSPKGKRFKRSKFAVRRKEKVEYPLIASYCFALFDIHTQDWWRALEIDGTRGFLSQGVIPCPVRHGDVEEIWNREKNGEFDRTIIGSTLRRGDRGKISEGILGGLIAKVTATSGKRRIAVELENGWKASGALYQFAKS